MHAPGRSPASYLALVVLVALAACGEAPTPTASEEASDASQAPVGLSAHKDACTVAASDLIKGAQELRKAAVGVRRECDDGSCEAAIQDADVVFQELTALYAAMVDACSEAPPAPVCGNGVLEGSEECDDGNLTSGDGCSDVCSVESGSPDVCDGIDNDFDPSTADGSADPSVGTACDGPDSDLCTEGVIECVGGSLTCSDDTGDDVEVCDGLDNDCDGQTDEGLLDTNPGCGSATFVASLPGDDGASAPSVSATGEAWYRFQILENDESLFSSPPLTAWVELQVAAGTDYDLYVYCESCGGTLAGFSRNSGSSDERVEVRVDDTFGDDTYDILVEVRYRSSSVCAPWTLTVRGNQPVSGETCS